MFILPFLLFSCTKGTFNLVAPSIESTLIETKSAELKGEDCFLVSEQDLSCYVKFRCLEKKVNKTIKSVDSILGDSGIPVAYILNYEEGWEVVSADRRTTPRLAYSEEGELDMDQCPDTQKAWLMSVFDEIDFLREMSEDQLSGLGEDNLEEMTKNTEFWDAITASESFLQRGVVGGLRGNRSQGYYELDGVIVDTLEYEVVNHLIDVHWHQNAPYNNYCPLRTDNPSLRAPAGCVAIAAAQVLWYLHMSFGYPVYAPDSAVVTGDIDDYTMSQSGQSSTIWGTMFTNGDNAAILVANVGKLVGMDYGNTGSGAVFTDISSYVFSPYDVDCDIYGRIVHSVVQNNLMNGLPVLVGAETANHEGHAFVIDGYKTYRVGHGYRYIWVSTDPSPDPQTIIDPILEVYIYYEDPFVREYTMNWGWGQTYDNGWYTTTGSWTVDGDSFDYGREMIANLADDS